MATRQRRLAFATRTAWRIAPHLVEKYAMATRVGPRSLTLQTPSRVRVTESNGVPSLNALSLLLDFELVLHRLHAAYFLGDLLGLLLGLGGFDVAFERDDAVLAVDVHVREGLEARVLGERSLHLRGERGAVGAGAHRFAVRLALLRVRQRGIALLLGQVREGEGGRGC